MFLVQIGRGDKAVQKIVKVYLAHVGGDGEFLDGLCGCSPRRMLRNCRLCMDAATSRLVMNKDRIVYRDDVTHERLVSSMERVTMREIESKTRRRNYKFSPRESNLSATLLNYSLSSGRNPLYALFSELNEKSILSFHKAVNPDRLHVVYKGIVEKTIAWTLSIVNNMPYFLPHRDRAMELIDTRVRGFPCTQAYEFCR